MINDVGFAATSRLIFESSSQLLNKPSVVNSDNNISLTKSRNECCNHIGMNITCSPHDYYFIKYEFQTDKLKIIFARITTVLSILFISNISELRDNTITFKINGYKTINGSENIKEYSNIISISEFIYEIFSWVYKDDSNIIDKIGITRNILSLHMNSAHLSNITAELIKSIYSGYEIYLKENVERYIEILNQLTYFLNELNNQASNLALSFTNKFRNNLLGFLSFLLSTILFNTISSGMISNIFTRDMTIITIAMLVISFCYLVISIIETKFNVNKLKSKYDRNKRYYASILDDRDINRILSNDDYFHDDKLFIQKNALLYSILWVISIIVIVVVLIVLGTLS